MSWLPVSSSHERKILSGPKGYDAMPDTQSSVLASACEAARPGPGSSASALLDPLVGATSPPMRTTPRRPMAENVAAAKDVTAKSW
jgi:hypothetical protein